MTTETKLTDLTSQFIANCETELNQTVPSQRRAWLRVLAVQQAIITAGIQKRVSSAKRELFAQTATELGLGVIGAELSVPRIAAVKAQFECEVDAGVGASVAVGVQLTSESTGAYYTVTTGGTESGGVIAFTVTADDYGTDPNLVAGEELRFTSAPADVDTFAEIISVPVSGADEEDLESWRARILEAERASYGGGNAADYRAWAESVSGVARAYPYAGKPIWWKIENDDQISFDASDNSINDTNIYRNIFSDTIIGEIEIGDLITVLGSASNDGFYTVLSKTSSKIVVQETITTEAAGASITITNQSQPGDRTVYIQADDADRIPSTNLVDLARAGISYDADGVARPGLGDTDATLYVEPVSVFEVDLVLTGLEIDATQVEAAKTAVVADVSAFLLSREPFIEGLDFEMDRLDNVSIPLLDKVIQSCLDAYGATYDTLSMSIDGTTATSWYLGQGRLCKLGTFIDENGEDWTE